MALNLFIEMLDEGQLTEPLAQMLTTEKKLTPADLDKLASIMLEHPTYSVRYMALDILLCRIALATSEFTPDLQKSILDVFYLYSETNDPADAQMIDDMKEGVVKFYLNRQPEGEALLRIYGFVESLTDQRQALVMMEFAQLGEDHAAAETQAYLAKVLESQNLALVKNALRLINALPGLLKDNWFCRYTHFLKSEIPEARYFASEILKKKSNLSASAELELKTYLASATVTADIDAAIEFMGF